MIRERRIQDPKVWHKHFAWRRVQLASSTKEVERTAWLQTVMTREGRFTTPEYRTIAEHVAELLVPTMQPEQLPSKFSISDAVRDMIAHSATQTLAAQGGKATITLTSASGEPIATIPVGTP